MIKIDPSISNGLTKTSTADCFQIRSISQARFIKYLGELSDSELDEIRLALTKVLSMDNEKG